MNKDRLLELVKTETDIEAIGMILSNYVDYGGSKGGMVSVNKFNEVAECIIEWMNAKNKSTPGIKREDLNPDFLKSIDSIELYSL